MNYIPGYIVKGTVIHGRGIGKLVGMPTANLKVERGQALPESGVYITKAILDCNIYYGITHIGTRPTVDNDQDISVETHILNFNKDIYGYKMEIQLFTKLRLPQRFDNLSFLLEQIRKDCMYAREFWGISPLLSRLFIDVSNHNVTVDKQEVYLSTKEFDVLYLLYSNPDVTFTKKQIYEAVWHEPANNRYHAVENTIFQIRKKLSQITESQNFIKTVVGYGYKINLK
ncbi:MAG: winged helix-turn-helix domain-containing protein [Clostridiales bacterium]|nr:winged helix-turn-helix domain-containing protein [Clostridiales bacterium]